MNSNPSFWSKGFNRAVVYGIGFLIVFGSYVMDDPNSSPRSQKVSKKAKLSASVEEKPSEKIESFKEPTDPREAESVSPSSVTIGPSKGISKSHVAVVAHEESSPLVAQYTAEEMCDELTATDSQPSGNISMFVDTTDGLQNSKRKEFVTLPISARTNLKKVVTEVQETEARGLTWQAYKLCNASSCSIGSATIQRGDWGSIPNLDNYIVASGEVYALVNSGIKLPSLHCIARTE